MQEMRVGPSEPAVRSRLQTTASCDGQEPWLDADQTGGDAKAQIPVEARCERGRVTQTQAAQPDADFQSAPRGRPVRKPGFRGEVSAKQVRNAPRFRPPQTPTPGPLP